MSKLEELAKELETFKDRKDLTNVIQHIRNDAYSREAIIKELISLNMRYFAEKIRSGYYELIEKIKNEK